MPASTISKSPFTGAKPVRNDARPGRASVMNSAWPSVLKPRPMTLMQVRSTSAEQDKPAGDRHGARQPFHRPEHERYPPSPRMRTAPGRRRPGAVRLSVGRVLGDQRTGFLEQRAAVEALVVHFLDPGVDGRLGRVPPCLRSSSGDSSMMLLPRSTAILPRRRVTFLHRSCRRTPRIPCRNCRR